MDCAGEPGGTGESSGGRAVRAVRRAAIERIRERTGLLRGMWLLRRTGPIARSFERRGRTGYDAGPRRRRGVLPGGEGGLLRGRLSIGAGGSMAPWPPAAV